MGDGDRTMTSVLTDGYRIPISILTDGYFGTVVQPGGVIPDVVVRPTAIALKGVEHVYQMAWGGAGKSVKWRVLDKSGIELMPMSAEGMVEFSGGAYGVPITISTTQVAYIEFCNETDNLYMQQPVTVIDIEQIIGTSQYGELMSIPVAGADMSLSSMLRAVFQYYIRRRVIRNTGTGTAIETMKKADGSDLAAANISDDGTIFDKKDMKT